MKKPNNHQPKNITAYNAMAARAQRRLAQLETFLWLNLPCVSVSNHQRADRQRVVFAWDGMRIVLAKQAGLPPPRGEDLDAAVDGLIDDVQVALGRAAIQPGNAGALAKAKVD